MRGQLAEQIWSVVMDDEQEKIGWVVVLALMAALALVFA